MLFETTGRASEAEVVVDGSGTVHVFWAYGDPGGEESGGHQAIYYAYGQGDYWSDPVDILISPGNRVARMHSVLVDGKGFIHIAWSGGNAIYYSRAHVSVANTAQGWMSPAALVLGANALDPHLTAGSGGLLYAVWTQTRAGLVFSRSSNGGDTWTEPSVVYEASGDLEMARWGRIAVDGLGRLHLVWTHVVASGEPGGRADHLLYYSRSDDGGDQWSAPLQVVAESEFGEINVITFGNNVVHLAWNGRAGRHGRYHRWSSDGGNTWSDVVEILAPSPRDPLGTGGLTGFPAMAVDATGVLHLISATGGGDYYFSWTEGQWSQPVLISPGLDGRGVTGEIQSLEQPSAAIGEGSQLHVVFHDGFERIWYTTRRLEVPHIAPRPLSTLPFSAAASVTATPFPVATAPPESASVSVNSEFVSPVVPASSAWPVWLGTLSAAIVVGGLVVVHQAFTRRR